MHVLCNGGGRTCRVGGAGLQMGVVAGFWQWHVPTNAENLNTTRACRSGKALVTEGGTFVGVVSVLSLGLPNPVPV